MQSITIIGLSGEAIVKVVSFYCYQQLFYGAFHVPPVATCHSLLLIWSGACERKGGGWDWRLPLIPLVAPIVGYSVFFFGGVKVPLKCAKEKFLVKYKSSRHLVAILTLQGT